MADSRLTGQVAQDTYRDNLWMQQLIARDPMAIAAYHMPAPNHPHCCKDCDAVATKTPSAMRVAQRL